MAILSKFFIAASTVTTSAVGMFGKTAGADQAFLAGQEGRVASTPDERVASTPAATGDAVMEDAAATAADHAKMDEELKAMTSTLLGEMTPIIKVNKGMLSGKDSPPKNFNCVQLAVLDGAEKIQRARAAALGMAQSPKFKAALKKLGVDMDSGLFKYVKAGPVVQNRGDKMVITPDNGLHISLFTNDDMSNPLVNYDVVTAAENYMVNSFGQEKMIQGQEKPMTDSDFWMKALTTEFERSELSLRLVFNKIENHVGLGAVFNVAVVLDPATVKPMIDQYMLEFGVKSIPAGFINHISLIGIAPNNAPETTMMTLAGSDGSKDMYLNKQTATEYLIRLGKAPNTYISFMDQYMRFDQMHDNALPNMPLSVGSQAFPTLVTFDNRVEALGYLAMPDQKVDEYADDDVQALVEGSSFGEVLSGLSMRLIDVITKKDSPLKAKIATWPADKQSMVAAHLQKLAAFRVKISEMAMKDITLAAVLADK
jgi:hypothetical protein